MGVYSATVYFPVTRERHLFDQQLAAPFDDYVLNAFAFAIDKATNESVRITRFTTADPLNNFVTVSRDTETVNEFTYETENGAVTIQAESRALEVRIHRSILAQAFTMSMLLVNWALTVGSLYITVVMLVKRERMSEAVLALPITVVLTIPVIRALFIGSPPFGILLGAPRNLLKRFPFSDRRFLLRYCRVFHADHSRCSLFASVDICYCRPIWVFTTKAREIEVRQMIELCSWTSATRRSQAAFLREQTPHRCSQPRNKGNNHGFTWEILGLGSPPHQ